MTEEPWALSAVDVSKRVGDGARRREVLRRVSVAVRAREILALRGPTGSGKTTLLGVLAGMLLPTSGEVWLEGEPISRLRDHQRAALRREKIGYVFQDFGLVPGMSARESVALALVPDAPARAEVASRVDRALARFGLGSLADAKVEALSGGERQRVALARALVGTPRVLLLDEPTAHLDSASVAALLDELESLAAEGLAVVVASHDPRVADDRRVSRTVTLVEGAVA